MNTTSTYRRQRGVSTLEAQIAIALMTLGMIGLARLHVELRAQADAARERSEAVRLAQQDLEQSRAFAGSAGWDAIADAESADVTPPGSTTAYRRERSVHLDAASGLKAVQVTLRWSDRHGAPQALQLRTLVGAADPALSGALALARPDL